MKSSVSKWGNSLGIRIPSAFAKELELEDGIFVDIELTGNKMIISTQGQDLSKLKEFSSEIDLNKMSKKVTKKNRPQFNDNEALGEEIW